VDCEKDVVGVEYVVEGGAVVEGALVAEPVLLAGTLEDMPLRFDYRQWLQASKYNATKSQQGLEKHYMMHIIHFIRQAHSKCTIAAERNHRHAAYHAPRSQKPRSTLNLPASYTYRDTLYLSWDFTGTSKT
jgi:hypothetical protein